MEISSIALAIVALALLADRFLANRQSQAERRDWFTAYMDATRKAVRIAIARSQLDYERAEAVAEAVDKAFDDPIRREPEPAPEGLN